MSVRAVAWALRIPRTLDPTARLVLTLLADRSDDDGRGAWPSQATLAQELETTERTVRRHLATLAERGLIFRGDQSCVAHLPADRRPVVWDLALPGVLRLVPDVERADTSVPSDPANGGTPTSERADTGDRASGHQRPVVADRGDTGVHDGGTPVTPRGDTGVHDGGTPTSAKPSLNHPEPPQESPHASRALAALPGAAPTGRDGTTNPQSAQTPTLAAAVAAMRAAVGGRR